MCDVGSGQSISSNEIHHKVWDEIAYPFQNLNDETLEI